MNKTWFKNLFISGIVPYKLNIMLNINIYNFRNFSTTNGKNKYSFIYHSDDLVCAIVLPCIDDRKKFKDSLKFELSLLKKDSDKSLSYKIEYYLYIHTNYENIELIRGAPLYDSVLDKKYSDPYKVGNHLATLAMLENKYEYKGFKLVYFDIYDPELVLDLKSYIKNVYDILVKYVYNKNDNLFKDEEDLDKDEFVENKKPTLFKVTKINKSNNSDLVKKYGTKCSNLGLIKDYYTSKFNINEVYNFYRVLSSKRFYSISNGNGNGNGKGNGNENRIGNCGRSENINNKFTSNSKYYIKNFDVSFNLKLSVKLTNFFDSIIKYDMSNIIFEDDELWCVLDGDNYKMESKVLYDYFYKDFFSKYYLMITELDYLKPGVNFNQIYLVFYKSYTYYDLKLEEKHGEYIWCGNKDNILYYEVFTIEGINDLRDKFVNAYKNGNYNDFIGLYKFLDNFCSKIIIKLCNEIVYKNVDTSTLKDLYLNIIIPRINKVDTTKSNNSSSTKEYNRLKTNTSQVFKFSKFPKFSNFSVRVSGVGFKRFYSTNSLTKSFSSSYNAILDIILDSKLTNFEKQKRIEETLMQYWRIELYNLISRKISVELSNDIGFNIIIRQLESLNEDITILFKKSSFINNKPYMKNLEGIDPNLIISVVTGKIIPFIVKYNDLEYQPITDFIIQIGEEILKIVYLEMYIRDLKNKKISSELKFYEYMKQNNLTYNEDESVKLGLDMLHFFSDRSNFVELKEVKVKKHLFKRKLIPREDFYKLLDKFTLIESQELPMLIPPMPWKIDNNGDIVEYGGNITNYEYRFKDLISSESHKNPLVKDMKFNNDLIDTINKMAQTEYTINKKVLTFITEKEYFIKGKGKENKKLIHFKRHEESTLLGKYDKGKNFIKVNEITTYNSKYLHDTSILNIARLMSNVDKFYITNFIDWRGRIYTSTCSLNMQGSELARGLILMSKGFILNENGLAALKIYTANAFGLDKKSKIDRIKWIDKHIKEIINFQNNDLWLYADEPVLFLACAFELKQYYENPQFLSRLPVLLDATCNGLQHLSAIANDTNLAQRVNILPSTDEEKPNDIYSDLIKPVKYAISDLVKDKPEFYNLSKLNITRKLIKRGIMTTTYGVTVKGILEQLLSEHFDKYDLVNNHYIYKPKDIASLGDICLYYKDIYELSRIIYYVLFKSHPTLDNIMNYFHNMVGLMNTLGLSITWITPHGLIISQRYSKFTKYDIISIMQGKRKKVILSKIMVDDNNKPYIDTVKQINSFIPNFIHSMDASHIVILMKKMISKYNFEIVTIHDCFGVHPNHAELLSHLVKESFISIYGDKDCIDKFHSHILNNIKAVYEIVDNQIIDVNGNVYKIPEKPILGDMDLKLQLLESKYFIN